MRPYVEKCKEHLKVFSRYGHTFSSVLELLYYYFAIEHSVDNAVMPAKFSKVANISEKLTLEDNDILFSAMSFLCKAYSKQGFVE